MFNQPKQPDVLAQIAGFISRYLQCTEHQRTVLALWVLHTYCSSAAQVTPYLSIQSASKQSGKSLCLQLLSLLCENPVVASGVSASKLSLCLRLKPVSALLLDECQFTVGTRSRTKAPELRTLLAGSFHRGISYSGAGEEHQVFCPKAFAGQDQLPEELADRSIPIILQLLEEHRQIEDFHLPRAAEETQPLKERLSAWAKENLPHLEKMPPYSKQDFPPGLSPRRQDMAEPLLQLADAVGGPWPARIRQAITALFEEETSLDLQPGLQILRDLYHCFFMNSFPLRVSIAVLLEWMRTMPARPWELDGPTLIRMLGAFDIRPRVQRMDSASPARGYLLADFLEPWRSHLGLALPRGIPGPAHRQPNSKALVRSGKDKNKSEIIH